MEGGVDPGMVMAVQIGPDGGIGVEIFAVVNIAEDGPLPFQDHNRLTLEPVAHLGERMPDVAVVELGEAVHGEIYDLRLMIYDLGQGRREGSDLFLNMGGS